jgi:hypothetical protein
MEGHGRAQAVSLLHFTVEARFRIHVSPCGISGGQSSNVTDFPPSPSVSTFSIVSLLLSIHPCIIWG